MIGRSVVRIDLVAVVVCALLPSMIPPVVAGPELSRVSSALGELAAPFVADDAQVDERVRYYARTLTETAFVTQQGEIAYSLPGWSADEAKRPTLGRAGSDRPPSRGHGWTVVEPRRRSRSSPPPRRRGCGIRG
ncbi:MAG: hypothetical protein HYV63_20465 [Candidatus Schekmanbacteria bacterium]|nr:hypothetical protein [Candidatus Schekmanbacteria bacterium]